MKKTALFLLFAAFALTALAQPQMPSVHFGELHKDYDRFMAYGSHIVSVSDNELVIVTNQTRRLLGNYGNLGLQVVATDTNLQVLRQVSLPKSTLCEVVAANYVDGKVYLLYQNSFIPILFRAVVDPQNMTIERNERLLTNVAGYPQEAFPWLHKSNNNLFYALAGVNYNPESKETLSRQILLDEKFELLWDKRYEASLVDDVFVTDDGVVYLFGSTYDKASRETIVEVCMLDVNDDRRITTHASLGEVFRLKILNIVGDKAVAAGYVRTPESPKNTDCFDKMVGISLDLITEELHTDVVPFTSDELNVYGNKSTRKENNMGMVDNLVLASRTATSYGGAMLLLREWKVTTHSTKAPDVHDYYTMGAVALGVDTTGRILWHKPFRTVCREATGSTWDLSTLLNAALRPQGDNVFLFLPEGVRTPTDYDITEPAKCTHLQRQDHACAIYAITKQGAVTKQVIPIEDKGCLMNVWRPLAPGKFLSLYSNSKKTGLVYVNF